MKKLLIVAAISAMFAGSAFADGFSGNVGANVGAGAGVFATGGYTTSTVNGSFNSSLAGPGTTTGSFTAGNQGYANTSVSFGSTQNNSSVITPAGAGFSNTSSESSGFTVSNQSGSENFGTSGFTSNSNGASQGGFSTESGHAAAGTVGFEGEIGAGFGAAGQGTWHGF